MAVFVGLHTKTVTKRSPANGRLSDIWYSDYIFKKNFNSAKLIMENFLQQSIPGLSLDLTEGEDWGKLCYYCRVLFVCSYLSFLVI